MPKAYAHAMNAAEESSGQISLQRAAAAEHLGVPAARIEQRLVRGHFEHAIVALAEQEQSDVVVLRARDEVHVHVPRGPASIGHSARFILDHVPCDVLLVRS